MSLFGSMQDVVKKIFYGIFIPYWSGDARRCAEDWQAAGHVVHML
jgi:predicted SpoU family rRNA methylase